MKTLNKSWSSPMSSSKKFLSRLLTHNLSRELDCKKFEVVYEGSLDLFNPGIEEPDVVVYSKDSFFSPLIAIEVCKKYDALEMTLAAERIIDRFGLKEFFVFDYETPCWYRLQGTCRPADLSSLSQLLNLDLNNIVYLDPKVKSSGSTL